MSNWRGDALGSVVMTPELVWTAGSPLASLLCVAVTVAAEATSSPKARIAREARICAVASRSDDRSPSSPLKLGRCHKS